MEMYYFLYVLLRHAKLKSSSAKWNKKKCKIIYILYIYIIYIYNIYMFVHMYVCVCTCHHLLSTGDRNNT